MSHGIDVCRCGAVIMRCRCMGPHEKRVVCETCDACRGKPVPAPDPRDARVAELEQELTLERELRRQADEEVAATRAEFERVREELTRKYDRERADFESRSKDYHATISKLAADRDAARADLERVTRERDSQREETNRIAQDGARMAVAGGVAEGRLTAARRDLEEALGLLKRAKDVFGFDDWAAESVVEEAIDAFLARRRGLTG